MTAPTLVFVVDDDPEMVDALEQVLRAEGFEVRGFTDPLVAFAAISEAAPSARPDLVLLDCVMPVMDGGEFLSAMRKASIDTPVVVLTALSDPSFCIAPGDAQIINKPFDIDQLVAEIYARGASATRPASRSSASS